MFSTIFDILIKILKAFQASSSIKRVKDKSTDKILAQNSLFIIRCHDFKLKHFCCLILICHLIECQAMHFDRMHQVDLSLLTCNLDVSCLNILIAIRCAKSCHVSMMFLKNKLLEEI